MSAALARRLLTEPGMRGIAFRLALAMPLLACTGMIGDPAGSAAGGGAGGGGSGGTQTAPSCTGVVEPGPSPLRRLTHVEYDNTIRDLLGDGTRPASGFASTPGVDVLLAEQYMTAAEAIAARATQDLRKLLPCDPAAAGELPCADAFISRFGRRAFRRPLDSEETARLHDLFVRGRDLFDFTVGIRLVVESVLQSSAFLYRVEWGAPARSGETIVRLGPFEMASRLSYLLWGSMPDDELLAAAESGRLGTGPEIAAQAHRLLADPQGRQRQSVASFHAQWLSLASVERLEKDPSVYPAFRPALAPLFRIETERFLDHAVWEGKGGLGTLLTAPYTFMNRELADFYGASGPTGPTFERVELDPAQRGGILTQASFLARLAKPNQTNPVLRGKWVSEQLLCNIAPPPPAFIPPAPEPAPGLTTRQRFAEHRTNPTCAACHRLMDPLGFGFESYDGVGLWRDTENGLPVDASGEIVESDIDGPFVGAQELGRKLAGSAQVSACMTRKWFRFAHGRPDLPEDQCSLAALNRTFEESGHDIRALLVALTQTAAFQYRRIAQGGAP